MIAGGLALCLTAALAAPASPPSDSVDHSKPFHVAPAQKTFGRLPLSFEQNQGQTDPRVKFLARGRGYRLFLTPTEAVLALRRNRSGVESRESEAERVPRQTNSDAGHRSPDEPAQLTTPALLRMKLVGSNPEAAITGADELPGKSNYFIGNDPRKWRTNVPNYAKVRYEDVYPGIDLVYYGNERQLEYDFVVAPGADPRVIGLEIVLAAGSVAQDGRSGAPPLRVDASGDLVIGTEGGEVRFRKPVVYQPILDSASLAPSPQSAASRKRFLDGRYILRLAAGGNRNSGLENRQSQIENRKSAISSLQSAAPDPHYEVAFEIASYDASRALVIDPVLSYSTYLGGGIEDIPYGIALDAQGNVYVTGSTGSADFPTSAPFQSANAGDADVFVAKLNPEGSALIYSTYLGGNGFDRGNGIAVDSSGNAYVTGSTASGNFPTTSQAFQRIFGGGTCGTGACSDAFVTKLNAAGSALVYSTYLGGGRADSAQAVAVDSSGSAYVTGSTESADSFPTSPPVQATGGGIDAFVTKLNAAGGALVYSTFLGGGGADFGQGLAVSSSGEATVTGSTFSTNFPTASAVQASSGGSGDAFLTRLNAAGSALVFSTYLGGSGLDQGLAVALDTAGNAYLTGDTTSADFPTTTGSFQTVYTGNGDAFVAKLDAGGAAPVYSTYLGGVDADQGLAITADSAGEAYLTGFTRSDDFPVVRPLQETLGGGLCGFNPCSDAFVTRINTGGSALVYSTYLGGGSADVGQGMAIDSSGNAYVTGSTASANFPATVGALQGLRAGTGPIEDAFVSKIGPLDAPAVALTPPHLTFTDQATGTTSAAQTVTVTNAGSAPLTISSIAVSGDFGQTNTCGGGLAAGGASCTISATFTPTATGDLEGAVTLTDDAAGSPHVVSLKGTGVTPAPAVSLTPSSLTFPEQTVGTTSDPQTISLTNSGSADLTITEISTGGDFAQSNDCPGTLGPGAGCTITVTFTPTASGDSTTAVVVTSDAAGSPHAATLSGTGLAVFSLSAPQTAVTVDRGTDSVTFTIAASAPSDFTSSISLSCVSTGSAACAFEPASITPGSSATLTVSELDNVATTSLDFSVDGTSGEQTAALPLTIQFAEFTLSVSPAFAAIAAGEAAVYTLTVTPTNGFTGEVSFGCSLLPSEASCSFLPDSITLDGSNPATIEVSLRTTERSRLAPPPPPPRTVPVLLILVTLAGLLMLAGAARPSLPRRAAPAAAVLFCALLLLSCGGIEFRPIRGTPSGTYQFWILAASGEIAQSVTASVTVN